MPSRVASRLVYYFPGTEVVPKASLLDRSLTSLAQNLNTGMVASHLAIFDLPLHLKEHLLSYIAVYWLPGITIAELQALLIDPDQSGDSSNIPSSQIRSLDVSHSIGSSIYFGDLSKTFMLPFLTHLCLAHPGPEVSWPSFLTFIETVSGLTHLSLAYWPKPTVGTEDSEDIDESIAPSLALRRLSESLTKLQYLDVEGCNDWRQAFLMSFDCGLEWAGSWKHVHSLNLSQGPMPVEVQFEGGLATEKWIQGEVLAKRIEDSINFFRRSQGMPTAPPIRVEHGWNTENFMIRFLVDKAYERHFPKGAATAVSGTADVVAVQPIATTPPT
ncbi:MAG: hypothetical protein Q9225_002274 [Loekoesia sp. 1 TL-2023]